MPGSSIKQKIGPCLDCPEGSALKALTAGRCSTHYWQHRALLAKNKPANKAKQADLKEMGVYMASQLPLIPSHCENQCGAVLTKSGPGGYKTHIAHILPKAKYKSVKTHPQNRWFGCGDCHTDYDKKGAALHLALPVAPLIIERFKSFMALLTDKELGSLEKQFPWLYAVYMEDTP
jgi:hypothetical protein